MTGYLARALELHPDSRAALVASETYLTEQCSWRTYANLRALRLVTVDGRISAAGHKLVDALEGRRG